MLFYFLVVCCVSAYAGYVWRQKRRRLLELAALTPTLKGYLPVVGNALVFYGDSEQLDGKTPAGRSFQILLVRGKDNQLKTHCQGLPSIDMMLMQCVIKAGASVLELRSWNEVKEYLRAFPIVDPIEHAEGAKISAESKRIEFIRQCGVADSLGCDLWESFKMVMNETTDAGGVKAIWFGPSLHYMITDPEDALTILNTCLEKNRYIYDMGSGFLGSSLINTEASRWKRNRKLLNPSFSKQLLDRFQFIFNAQSKKLVKNLEPLAGKESNSILSQLSDTAITTICATVFGISGEDETLVDQNYKDALKSLHGLLARRIANVFLHPDIIFNMTSMKATEDKLLKTVGGQSFKVIAQRKKERAAQRENTNPQSFSAHRFQSFLDLILDFAENDHLFEDHEIRDELNSLMSGGYDTLAIALPYILILIGSHPEVQKKLYEEIMSVVGPSDDVTKYHDTPYLDAVLKEALRLYPTVPVVSRDCHEEVKLKNYTLPAGCHCTIGIWAIQRLPIWGTDADQFRPERWLEPHSLPKNPGAYCAFSLGKRNCIGKYYSMVFSKTLVVYVVRRFLITANITDLRLKFEIMLKPVSGDHLRLDLR